MAPLPVPSAKKIYTVAELVFELKDLVNERFPAVWVRGEISNVKGYASGHAYPTLKDGEAQLSCALFKGVKQGLKFELEDGLAVVAFGRLDIYPPRGTCQFIIQGLEPDGVGALQLAFEQLKKKLAAEGLFEAARKKPIPFLPKTVGLVTSWHGAALHDMLTVMRRRFPNIHILIYPVAVQGDKAKTEIAAAIRFFSESGLCDVMIVGRGGGSLEDLWAFNEEAVARAIAASNIPVISAVGHEVDFTIADFVADLRAPTPSAAAELCVPDKMDVLAALKSRQGRLLQAQRHILQQNFERLQQTRRRLPSPRRIWDQWRLKLGRLQDDLYQTLVLKIREARFHLREVRLRLTDPQKTLQNLSAAVRQTRLGLVQTLKRQLLLHQQALEQKRVQLRLLSPQNVLKRGYVLTKSADGRLITRQSQIRVGERLQLIYQDGSVVAEIKEG